MSGASTGQAAARRWRGLLRCAFAGSALASVLASTLAAAADPADPASAVAAVSSVPRAARPQLLWDGPHQRAALADGTQVIVAQPPVTPGQATQPWQVLGQVPAPGVQHLAAGPDDGSVYASASAEGVLKFIDLVEGRQRHQVPAAGVTPGALVYHPVLKRLASFNGGGNVTLFDSGSRAYEGLLPLGETPAAVALAPDGRVLAVLAQQHVLAVLALRPFRMVGRFSVPEACTQPGEVLVDAAGQRIFVDCGDASLAVLDYRQGEWLTAWSWPAPDAEAAPPGRHLLWDSAGGRVLALRADGRLELAAALPGAAHVLMQLPAGTAADWDAAGHQLVLARPVAAPAGTFQFSFQQVP